MSDIEDHGDQHPAVDVVEENDPVDVGDDPVDVGDDPVDVVDDPVDVVDDPVDVGDDPVDVVDEHRDHHAAVVHEDPDIPGEENEPFHPVDVPVVHDDPHLIDHDPVLDGDLDEEEDDEPIENIGKLIINFLFKGM